MFSDVSGIRSMPARARSWRIPLGAMAVICLVIACAVVEQKIIGWNEESHFSQVRAFDHGTAIVDPYRHTTGDRAIYHGHFYGDKAPGLAFLTLPVYHVARATSLVGTANPRTVHLLVLFGCVLPVAVMLLLGWRLVETLDPGQGAAAAVTLGLGTMLLPFATLFFSHVLGAGLGFASFYLLWRGRERGNDGLGHVIAAGVLAGYAISSEYPLALLAVLLGAYAIWRRDPVRTGLAYGGGVLVGLVPLLLYDWWAFGSPFHLSYSYVAANSSGVLGLGAPSLRTAVRLLVADRGLFVVSPVVAAALAGIVVLYREGRRTDAVIAGAVFAAYFGYNACYYLPFGGGVPGPRFLLTMLPFLIVPLAAAYRKAPVTTLALGVVSSAIMIVATLTGPVLDTGRSTRIWWRRLEAGHFKTPGWTVVAFAVLALLAVVLAARATPRRRITVRDLKLAVLGIGGWLALTRAGPALLARDLASGQAWGMLALIVLVVALAAVITRVALDKRLAWFAGVPLVALALRPLDRTTLTFVLVAVSLALLVALAHSRPRRIAL
jgi:hypothetical protein